MQTTDQQLHDQLDDSVIGLKVILKSETPGGRPALRTPQSTLDTRRMIATLAACRHSVPEPVVGGWLRGSRFGAQKNTEPTWQLKTSSTA